ncbi:hypothetical protein R1flu_016972 [Riccia fluitans]|uniref:Uncharacterized protein n=1 Tax=Riccia fluitans TaxID=41844 RepID=A0ABD1YNW6_9MARC
MGAKRIMACKARMAMVGRENRLRRPLDGPDGPRLGKANFSKRYPMSGLLPLSPDQKRRHSLTVGARRGSSRWKGKTWARCASLSSPLSSSI